MKKPTPKPTPKPALDPKLKAAIKAAAKVVFEARKAWLEACLTALQKVSEAQGVWEKHDVVAEHLLQEIDEELDWYATTPKALEDFLHAWAEKEEVDFDEIKREIAELQERLAKLDPPQQPAPAVPFDPRRHAS
jgi:hypothetical protein